MLADRSKAATTRRQFLLFLAAYAAFSIASNVVSSASGRSGGALINGDAKGYYAWLRSIAFDHDVDFRNDYALIYPPEPPPPAVYTPRGLLADKYPIGVAITEVPGFVVGHAVALAFGARTDGVSPPYQFAITIWLQLACLASFILLWHGLVRRGARGDVAALIIASALCATNIIQYVGRPAMAHLPGVAALNIAFYLFTLRTRRWRLALAGAMLGLALIIRPSNIALAPLFLCHFPDTWRRTRAALELAVGAVPVVALHFVSMYWLWGAFTISGYAGEGFTAGLRGILGTLASSRHGLFVYHLWYGIMLGLCIVAVRRRATRWPAVGALASFATLTVINGTWWAWWFGDSFGNRGFIEIIPALIIPVALWLSTLDPARIRTNMRAFAGVTATLTAVNLLLWAGYVLHRFPLDGQHTISQAYFWWLRR